MLLTFASQANRSRKFLQSPDKFSRWIHLGQIVRQEAAEILHQTVQLVTALRLSQKAQEAVDGKGAGEEAGSMDNC